MKVKGQSKKASVVEVIVNVLLGYTVAVTAQYFIFPWFGLYVTLADNMLMGLIFTVVSIIRSYCLRRMFNWFTVRHN